MSDTQQQPDWWLASDGKWYPPQSASPPPKKKGGCLKLIGIGVGVVILLIIVASIAGGSNKSKSTSTTQVASKSNTTASSATASTPTTKALSKDDDASITKCDLNSELNSPEAVVSFLNHSSKTSDYSVTVAFENPDGSQFDTGTAAVRTLAPGQKGEDTASSLKEGAPSKITCKITDVQRFAS